MIPDRPNRPNSGEIYTHFKGKRYKVLHIAKHTETEEELVIYQSLYGGHGIYARPLEMFLSSVDREKYPEVKQKYRFEKTQFTAAQPEAEQEEIPQEAVLLMEFLDLASNEAKIYFLQRHKDALTDHFLNGAAQSLGFADNSDTFEARYEGIMDCLRMKMRYESERFR